MFEKILVCLDGSKLAEQILPYAIEQARRFESKVLLIRVIPEFFVITPGVPGAAAATVGADAADEYYKREREEARGYLAAVAEQLMRDFRLDPETVALQGEVGQVIVKYADQNDVGLIAITTRGRSGLERVVFGSVADFVLRESGRPILLIKPREDKE